MFSIVVEHVLHVEHVDAERVAWLGVCDVHGAVDLIKGGEDESVERAERGGGGDLAVGGIETVEGDCVARGDVDYGRDAMFSGWA